MFKDESLAEPAPGSWFADGIAVVHPSRSALDDEIGAVAPIYREIARRIPINAYTRHESTLGGTSC
jgi:hypothetical protein